MSFETFWATSTSDIWRFLWVGSLIFRFLKLVFHAVSAHVSLRLDQPKSVYIICTVYIFAYMCDSQREGLHVCMSRTFTCDSCFTPWPLSLSVWATIRTRLFRTYAIHTPHHVKAAEAGRQKKRHILSILHTPPSCCFSSLSAPPDASSHLLRMRWELRTRCGLSFVNCLSNTTCISVRFWFMPFLVSM